MADTWDGREGLGVDADPVQRGQFAAALQLDLYRVSHNHFDRGVDEAVVTRHGLISKVTTTLRLQFN